MGYNTSPRLIEENLLTLREILSAVKRGEEISYRVDPEVISSEQYRLRRVLAATDMHRTAFGGEFAGLGSSVTLKVDAERSLIRVRPLSTLNLTAYKPNEDDALAALESTKGSMTLIEFWPSPSYSERTFVEKAKALGWLVIPSTRIEESDGKLTFAAELVTLDEEPSGFDAL